MIGTSVLLLCLTAAAFAQDVHVTYNHGIDFTQFHTYAWGQMPKPSQVKNPQLAKETQNQLNATLTGKSLHMVALTAKPDLILTISGASKEKTLYSNYDPSGTVLTAGTDYGTPEQQLIGALVVDLYDTNAKKLVWRGTAVGVMNQKSLEKNKELLDKAVSKMFDKFPYAPGM
jgi:hypothetical protein